MPSNEELIAVVKKLMEVARDSEIEIELLFRLALNPRERQIVMWCEQHDAN